MYEQSQQDRCTDPQICCRVPRCQSMGGRLHFKHHAEKKTRLGEISETLNRTVAASPSGRQAGHMCGSPRKSLLYFLKHALTAQLLNSLHHHVPRPATLPDLYYDRTYHHSGADSDCKRTPSETLPTKSRLLCRQHHATSRFSLSVAHQISPKTPAVGWLAKSLRR